jgi:pentafunctional AROM polypeptide
MFDYRDGPAVVVDMAYRPAETPLLGLARKIAGEHWSAVTGLEVLLEQGYEQFRIWTGRTCPRSPVAKHVWAKYSAGS